MDLDFFFLEFMCQFFWWGSFCILFVQYLMFGDNGFVFFKSWELCRIEVFMGFLEMFDECILKFGWRVFFLQVCLLFSFWVFVNVNVSRVGERFFYKVQFIFSVCCLNFFTKDFFYFGFVFVVLQFYIIGIRVSIINFVYFL